MFIVSGMFDAEEFHNDEVKWDLPTEENLLTSQFPVNAHLK